MADELTNNGLETTSGTDLLESLQNNLQSIFSPNGEEIDFDSNTPDGQFTNILTTIGVTHRELITQVYNATDPAKCIGTQQDTKYALNYLTRKAGTYTTQSIAITATKTVNLQGLDGSYTENVSTAFTIADDSGYNWYLIDSTTITAGITSLEFRAQETGNIIPTIGTITKMVTILDGITNVINNVGYTTLGTNQESDEEFRLRRERSLYLASGNNADKIMSDVLDLEGVNDARLHVNYTNETDSTGTESKTVWLVVDGGANSDIGDILYNNVGGCLTRGSITQNFTNIAGEAVTMYFDRPIIEPYYIKMDLYAYEDIDNLNKNAIIEGLVNNLNFLLGQNVDTQSVYNAMDIALGLQGGKAYAQNIKISTGGSAVATSTSTVITSIAVNVELFQSVVFGYGQTDESGNYEFKYNGSEWEYNGETIEISNYGITYEGTPTENDTIIVTYTAGIWVDLITNNSIQIKYATDVNRIYITVKE